MISNDMLHCITALYISCYGFVVLLYLCVLLALSFGCIMFTAQGMNNSPAGIQEIASALNVIASNPGLSNSIHQSFY